jgi:hypothetical protein
MFRLERFVRLLAVSSMRVTLGVGSHVELPRKALVEVSSSFERYGESSTFLGRFLVLTFFLAEHRLNFRKMLHCFVAALLESLISTEHSESLEKGKEKVKGDNKLN